MICCLSSRRPIRALCLLIWCVGLLFPVAGRAESVTHVVPPGAPGISVPMDFGGYTARAFGASHGTVTVTADGIEYTPSPSFWHLGTDTAMLVSRFFGSEPLHLRFVAGISDLDGTVTTVADPLGGPYAWELDGAGVQKVKPDASTLGLRFALDGQTAATASAETFTLGTGGPDNSTTTSDIRVVIDDIKNFCLGILPCGDVEASLAVSGPREIYRITNYPGRLSVELGVDPQTGGLAVRPVSDLDQSAAFLPFATGSSLRLVRGWQGFGGFASLQVDNGPPEIIATFTGPQDFEGHELTVSQLSVPGATITFEEPVVRMSDGWTDASVWVAGLDFEDPALDGWTSGGVVGAWSVSGQMLGTVDSTLEVDLGQVADGQWAYLRSPDLVEAVPAIDPLPGFGLRFWYDDSEVQMPDAGRVGLAAICPDGSWCGALRLRLEQVGGQRWLVASAKRDGTTSTPLWTETPPGPHLVEARLQNSSRPEFPNGWIDLWIDGAYAGRISGLINHGQVSEMVQIGALGVSGEVTGTLRFDDLEVWRFE